jgi:2-polyprenyl-3-methyl-5-hydroxy-6-metoxy-1,4-benzoquinol methylase
MTTTFNQDQYNDLLFRSEDVYAQTKYDVLLGHLAGRRGLRILNAGCGSGELCLQLARQGHHVLGIDPVPEYIDLALQGTGPGGDPPCRFEVSSIEDYGGEGGFDCVIATDVLEHIEDDRAAFAKLARLARPGGLILITVPAGQWLFGYHDEALGHFRRYSRKSLRALAGAFCEVESVRYFGFTLIPLCCLYSKVLRKQYPVGRPGGSSRFSVLLGLARVLLQVDRRLPLPLGTSLILKGTRK